MSQKISFLVTRIFSLLLSSFIIFVFLGNIAIAASEVQVDENLSTTWAANSNGPWIEFNPNGSVKRIYSKNCIPVEFPDRRGIHKAQIIAEEKAKAEIIRFLKQDIASSRVVTEIQNDVNEAVQKRETGTKTNIKKTDSRTIIENLTEITESFATGTLSGVSVLAQDYDEKAEEACVVVGISDKTIAAVRNVKSMLSNHKNKQKLPQDGLQPQQSGSRRSPQVNF